MPNWCDSELTISGDEEEIKRFKELARKKSKGQKEENVLNHENFIPYPKGLKFDREGYDWCVKNWGSKWGICDAELENESKEELRYYFQSAWSPVEPLIIKMSKMFPKLTFYMVYFEAGMGFNGMIKCKKGKVISKGFGDYFGNRGG